MDRNKIAKFLVGASFIVFIYGYQSGNDIITQIALGGFIGGFTNTIAIDMLFTKRWYLPGSGVLIKKHEDLIESLSNTIDSYIINRKNILEYINSKEFHNRIKQELEKTGVIGKLIDITGIADFGVVTNKIQDQLDDIVENAKIKEIIQDKLKQYNPEGIKDIVKKAIAKHLSWLEIFGVIIGAVFSGIFVTIGG